MEGKLHICTDLEALEKTNEKLKKEFDRTKEEIEKVFRKHKDIIFRGELDKELPTDINPFIVNMLLTIMEMDKQSGKEENLSPESIKKAIAVLK
jgi:hypothetical protein